MLSSSFWFKYRKGNEQDFCCLFSLRQKAITEQAQNIELSTTPGPFLFCFRILGGYKRILYDALLFVVNRVVFVKKKIYGCRISTNVAGLCCSRMDDFSAPLLCIPRQKIMCLGVPHVGESIHSVSPLKHSCCPHSRSCGWHGTT